VKKISTVAKSGNKIFKEPKLTIGLDVGDRTSHYCILDEAGNVILEHHLPTTPKGILQVFSRSWAEELRCKISCSSFAN
jgi:transposase